MTHVAAPQAEAVGDCSSGAVKCRKNEHCVPRQNKHKVRLFLGFLFFFTLITGFPQVGCGFVKLAYLEDTIFLSTFSLNLIKRFSGPVISNQPLPRIVNFAPKNLKTIVS